MTVRVKRFFAIPWLLGLNSRELKVGEEVNWAVQRIEGIYSYQARLTAPDTVETKTTLPYQHYKHGLGIIDSPTTTRGTAIAKEINGYGPNEDRPIVWLPQRSRR